MVTQKKDVKKKDKNYKKLFWNKKKQKAYWALDLNKSLKTKYQSFIKRSLINKALLLRLHKYCLCTIKQEDKNVYVNIATLYGQVLYETHSGLHFKTSLRQSVFSLAVVFRHVHSFLYTNFYKFKGMIINIKGKHYARRLAKRVEWLFKVKIKFFKINIVFLEAHNGIRLQTRRRK